MKDGGTVNMRGLRREADTAQYEFAYEMDRAGADRGARVDVPTDTGIQARRTISRLRNAGDR